FFTLKSSNDISYIEAKTSEKTPFSFLSFTKKDQVCLEPGSKRLFIRIISVDNSSFSDTSVISSSNENLLFSQTKKNLILSSSFHLLSKGIVTCPFSLISILV